MSLLNYEKDGGIGILALNRPDALNALNQELLSELLVKIEEIANDESLKALIITGEGRAFAAGADIAQMQSMSMMEGRAYGALGAKVFRAVEKLDIPVIAAVNGFALGGGCELAMSCDIILASEKAKFGQPEVGLGITPGFSGTQRLPRRIGASKAKELIFSGNVIGAEQAESIGLVDHVYAPDDLMAEAKKMAESFAKNASIAVKLSKAAINRGLQMDIDDGIMLENELFGMCFATEDQKEGMSAFLEKRDANFKNR